MDIGTFLFMLAFAYGLGVFWYDLLPGRLSDRTWRVAAYPFALMAFGEAFLPVGPSFAGIHVITALVAALIGVVLDWIIQTLRQPTAVPTPETTAAPLRG
ncbi:MAG TPA: hypothetical protein VFB73_11795 [Chloroflexota bacterium]|nr:hypothetical protein [Chloroflexota bacterium]